VSTACDHSHLGASPERAIGRRHRLSLPRRRAVATFVWVLPPASQSTGTQSAAREPARPRYRRPREAPPMQLRRRTHRSVAT
jgi:hypothetical protein